MFGTTRFNILASAVTQYPTTPWVAYVSYTGISLTLVSVAAYGVAILCPEAGGSGTAFEILG